MNGDPPRATPADPPRTLVIRAARVLTPAGIQPAEVHIRAGVITAVTQLPGRTTAPRGPRSAGPYGGVARPIPAGEAVPGSSPNTIDLADDEVLIPGLVDTHVHVNEPGRTHWEGFFTATAAAVAGGVTTLIDMPLNSIPPVTDVAALEVKRRAAAGQCFTDVGFWAGAVPDNAAERPGLHRAGVFGFKCFMVDSGVPEFPPLGDGALAAAMRQVAELGSLLIVHAEDAAVIGAAGSARAGSARAGSAPAGSGRAGAADSGSEPARAGARPRPAGRGYAGFLRSRPPAAEVAAIARVIGEATASGARVHVLHLSSADGVPPIAAARAGGVAITAETCPHYLAIVAEDVGPGQTQFKCCPPIREAANAERLWEALRSGAISCVVSDHSPCPPGLKGLDTGDFGAAWGGISSVQLGLPVVWTAARQRGFGLADVLRWMSANPAALAGLASKGEIAPGRDADLVAFAPDASFAVEPDRLLTRHRLTPYAGRRLSGVVRRTWLRGITVWDGQAPGPPAGRLLRTDDFPADRRTIIRDHRGGERV